MGEEKRPSSAEQVPVKFEREGKLDARISLQGGLGDGTIGDVGDCQPVDAGYEVGASIGPVSRASTPIYCNGEREGSRKHQPSASQRVMVYCRLRPPLGHEKEQHANRRQAVFADSSMGRVVVWLPPSSRYSTTPEKTKRKIFSLDQVFNSTATQAEVYHNVMFPLAQSVLSGVNSCIIAYGQTGAGKTFTTFGPTKEYMAAMKQGSIRRFGESSTSLLGVIPRAVHTLFNDLDARVDKSRNLLKRLKREEVGPLACGKFSYAIHVSYYQLYLDSHIQDLLDPSRENLHVRRVESVDSQKSWSHQVDGLSQHRVTTVDQVLALLARGERNKVVAHTAMNCASSRAHSIFTVQVTQHESRALERADLKHMAPPRGDTSVGYTSKSKLTCVDLAGSERASRTHPTGLQLEEAKSINKSLSALGNVISALSNNCTRDDHESEDSASVKTSSDSVFVPWRDSKLTKLLQDSLDGRSRVSLVINVGPDASNTNETINSLLFGRRSMSVTLEPIENISVKQHTGHSQRSALAPNSAQDVRYVATLEEQLLLKQREIDFLKQHSSVGDLLERIEALENELRLSRSRCRQLQKTGELLEETLLEQLQESQMRSSEAALVSPGELVESKGDKAETETIASLRGEIYHLREALETERFAAAEHQAAVQVLQAKHSEMSEDFVKRSALYESLLMEHQDFPLAKVATSVNSSDKTAKPISELASPQDHAQEFTNPPTPHEYELTLLKSKLRGAKSQKSLYAQKELDLKNEYERVVAEKDSEIIRLRENLEEYALKSSKQLEGIREEVHRTQELLKRREGELKRVNMELEDALDSKDQSNSRLHDDMQIVLQRYTRLEETSATVRAQLEEELDQSKYLNQDLKHRVSNLQGAVQELNKRSKAQKESREQAVSELARVQKQLKDSDAKVSSLEGTKALLVEKLEQITGRLSSAERKLQEVHEVHQRERGFYEELVNLGGGPVLPLPTSGSTSPIRKSISRKQDGAGDVCPHGVMEALKNSRLALQRAMEAIAEPS